MRNFWKTAALSVAILLVAGGVAVANGPASGDTLTGCLKANGTIARVALGDEPTKDCKTKQTQVSWSQGAATGGGGAGVYYTIEDYGTFPDLPDPLVVENTIVQLPAGTVQVLCEPGDIAIDGGLIGSWQQVLGGERGGKNPIGTLPVVSGSTPIGYVNGGAISSGYRVHSSEVAYVYAAGGWITCLDQTP